MTSDDLKFRLRRTSGDAVKEWVTEGYSASFVDAAGTYQYEVRAEASCGAAGPWTPALLVVVAAPPPNLVLVVEPKPIIVVAGPGTASAWTSFGVRNTGAGPATVSVSSDSAALVASPAKFSLAPNQVVFITVTLAATQSHGGGRHGDDHPRRRWRRRSGRAGQFPRRERSGGVARRLESARRGGERPPATPFSGRS